MRAASSRSTSRVWIAPSSNPMWLRTALLLILLLVALRVIRDVVARLKAPPAEPAKPADPARPGASPADWPPGEITDVAYRETRTANRD